MAGQPFHYTAFDCGRGPACPPRAVPVVWFGYYGVELFFVISGFIIAWVAVLAPPTPEARRSSTWTAAARSPSTVQDSWWAIPSWRCPTT